MYKQGRQRDIVIAKIKGIKNISQNSEKYETGLDQSNEFIYYIPSGKPWRTHAIDSELLPFWSTRYNHSFMLWDEIKCYSKCYEEHTTSSGRKSFIISIITELQKCRKHPASTDSFTKPDIYIIGGGFPDVTSHAWIKWKSNV